MANIDIADVAKIFSTTQNLRILDDIKRNSVAFRRLFDLCVALQIAPSGMMASNRRSIMNEISRAYGFADFAEVENCRESKLDVFKKPIQSCEKADWTRALKNNNYNFTDKEIGSANFLSNKILKFILSQGVHCDDLNTLIHFRSFPLDRQEGIYVQNKEFSTNVLSHQNLFWEAIIANVSQYAIKHPDFNKSELSIDLSIHEIGSFEVNNIDLVGLMEKCPSTLFSGRIEYSAETERMKFYFSKKLLGRIQYKKQRKNFLEMIGLGNMGTPTLITP